MLLLAIDTAANLCAAAVYDMKRQSERARAVEDIGRGHAERLMAVIAAALSEAKIGYGDLARIAVTVGPGSFTGIRVGIATARGLALALAVPAVAVTTLQAIVRRAEASRVPARPLMAVLDARRGEVFCQLFGDGGTPLSDPSALTLEQAGDIAVERRALLVGPGSHLLADRLPGDAILMGESAYADIGDIAAIGALKAIGAAPAPLYLRAPDAKPQTGFALPRQA